jgi:hypothetical protein
MKSKHIGLPAAEGCEADQCCSRSRPDAGGVLFADDENDAEVRDRYLFEVRTQFAASLDSVLD